MAFKMKHSSPLNLINEGPGDKTKNKSNNTKKISGTTGSVSKNPSPGKVSDDDKKYFEGISKFTENRPSGDYGGVAGFKVKQAISKGDYSLASQEMKKLKSTNKEAFNKLNQSGVKYSGFNRGGRYSDKKLTKSGKLSGDMSTRTDNVFDPATQTTTKKKYKFS
jgi:hypothetical protein